MGDNSITEQPATRQSAESVARSQNVNGRILARAYQSIADRSRLLEGLAHIRSKLLAVVQSIDRLQKDVERD